MNKPNCCEECKVALDSPSMPATIWVCDDATCSCHTAPTNKETTPELEKLSEEIHKLYCAQYEKDNRGVYWTGGDYSMLDERTKEYDRNIARWHLESLATATAEAYKEGVIAGETTKNGSGRYQMGYADGKLASTAEAEQRGRDMAVDYVAIGIEGVVKELDSGMWMLSVDHSHFNDLLEAARRGSGEITNETNTETI